MLYLLFVLTFLCGILFYGMSPSDKSLDMTAHQAEGMIISFINQHQAAKDCLYTWLGYGQNDASILGNTQSDYFLKAEVNCSGSCPNRDCRATQFNFEQMTPRSITSDMCFENKGIPGQDSCVDECGAQIPGFVSKVVVDGTKHYVMTYGGWKDTNFNRPDWWPRKGTRMRRFESWRKAIATRTRGSVSCGVLVKEGSDWCIDNGKTVYKNESATTKQCMNKVPSAVISALPYTTDEGKEDLLFCYSEFKQGVQPGHYATTPTHFYDGLSNAGVGQRQTSGAIHWKNLVNTASDEITTMSQYCSSSPCLTLTNVNNSGSSFAGLTTNMPLSGSYTITILAKTDRVTNRFDFFANETTSDTPVFRKLMSCDASGSLQNKVCFKVENGSEQFWFQSYNQHDRLISWTIVVDASKMRVYENAVLQYEGAKPTLTGPFKMQAYDNNGVDIYGIRYYGGTALSDKQIQKNFKVDQKRFGISDVNNGNLNSTVLRESEAT